MGRGSRKRGTIPASLLYAGIAMLHLAQTGGSEPLHTPTLAEPAPIDRLSSAEVRRQTAGNAECINPQDCNDGQACTMDICSKEKCINIPIADCVPCDVEYTCPAIDVVFIMDTSGSMRDEAADLCGAIAQVIADLNQQGVDIQATLLGITQTPGGSFSCLTNHVVGLLGSTVPGKSGSCPFPKGTSTFESWGSAVTIVADRFSWRPNVGRVVVPISDEGPCGGSHPEGCNDPGDDRDSIDNAIEIAIANNVVVSPISGSGSDACVISLAEEIADQTGGMTQESKSPDFDFIDAIGQIVLAACETEDQCDDQHACTSNDRCHQGICVGTPIEDCRPCSTPALCDDEDACTTDSCLDGICISTPNYDESTMCCDPTSGLLATINDGDPCTRDVCNPITGQVGHPPSEEGTNCSDGKLCTVMDTCDGSGQCSGIDAEAVPCISDADCFGLTCDLINGFCSCGNMNPELCLTAIPGGLPETECFSIDDDLFVTLDLGGSSRTIVGGQFLIEYDPAILDFVDIEPGVFADPESPFDSELVRTINEVQGTIFYAVSVPFGTPGTRGPDVMARIQFRPLQACGTDELCILSKHPANTILVDHQGRSVPFTACCTNELIIHDEPPQLACPGNVEVNAAPGTLSAMVTWPRPITSAECGEVPEVTCTGTNSFGADVSQLAYTGGRLPGTSEFECLATDDCGVIARCEWNVEVRNANSVEVDLQLSPLTASGPLRRCIVFEFFSNCADPPLVVEQTVEFGFPYNLPGYSADVSMTIPAGQYTCVSARDPKHTLRSVSSLQAVNGKYLANFTGDPVLGGRWLLGGNLDGNDVIDTLDDALLAAMASTTVNPHTPCGTSGIHADINGDGLVNSSDRLFIQRNFLARDRVCCGTTAGAPASETSSLAPAELDDLGLSELKTADSNHDGVVDALEIISFLSRKSRTYGSER